MYDITDGKPRHVVTYNVLFILKWAMLAVCLVLYKYLTEPALIQASVIAGIHAIFLL